MFFSPSVKWFNESCRWCTFSICGLLLFTVLFPLIAQSPLLSRCHCPRACVRPRGWLAGSVPKGGAVWHQHPSVRAGLPLPQVVTQSWCDTLASAPQSESLICCWVWSSSGWSLDDVSWRHMWNIWRKHQGWFQTMFLVFALCESSVSKLS